MTSRKSNTPAVIMAMAATGLLIGLVHHIYLKQSQVNKPLSNSQTTVPNPTSPTIGQRTKTSGCVVNGGLEDAACTPGAIIPTASKDQICVSGYAKSVRNVSTAEKTQVYAEYGIQSHTTGQYEVDHLVSLELGGSNDIANLWPEAAQPVPGYHQKDQLENYLHDQVCNGSLRLDQAQQEIANNWLLTYNNLRLKM